MATILVVEDSADIASLVTETLESVGHRVAVAKDGLAARQHLQEGATTADLVILDLMLPHVDGGTLLKELRITSQVPVLILSAKDAVWSKVDLLRLGADDYMVKPFDLTELTARVESLLRRSGLSVHRKVLEHGALVMDTASATVTVHGCPVELTATEFRILEMMLHSPAQVFSRAQIYEAVWAEPFMGDDGAIKTHVSNLRSKLAAVPHSVADSDTPEYIQTVWGLGYRLAQQPS
ncbi:response regulator transcription factor [Kocuria sp.]|uniref:response regulator transcription factor n=1 Tax=Kocuria sp. TaxID=1871328 RepID=UPI0026DEB366|nr:response regulator transcription factor [Kocuria sp.]MDO5618821.1 response regulator transcription factor [Kocuria sp.]